MNKYHFFLTLSHLRLQRKYLFFSAGYGLTTLIVPFSVQYLVNSLSLAGIWMNSIVFLIIIAIGLILSQVFKYSQFILSEYIQREIFMDQMKLWSQGDFSKKSQYYFDSIAAMKSFAFTMSQFIDIGLVASIGLLTLILLHPTYIILSLILVLSVLGIKSFWKTGLKSSLDESNIKYLLHHQLAEGGRISQKDMYLYLSKRDDHFRLIKRSKFIILAMSIISQLSFLALGIYLIQKSSLSIGQFVSAEIILSTVLVSFSKIPKTLESLYDFETSMIKVSKAQKVESNQTQESQSSSTDTKDS